MLAAEKGRAKNSLMAYRRDLKILANTAPANWRLQTRRISGIISLAFTDAG